MSEDEDNTSNSYMAALTNNTIIYDRVFWIYFIVTLFFIIVGISSIISSSEPYMLVISILWLLSNVTLMIIIYHASITWAPINPYDENSVVCVVDMNSGCFDVSNRVWLFINVLFIILLILAILWAGELGNTDAGPLRTMSGVLILLGGLILSALCLGQTVSPLGYDVRSRSQWANYKPRYNIPFWVSVAYLVIWFGLTLYVILTAS